MTNIKNYGFLFDLDGVLIDSEKEYTKIWSEVNKVYPSGFDNLASRIKGCTLEKILSDYYPDLEIRDKVVKMLYDLEAKMHYEYLPGAQELLDRLIAEDCHIAMVTSSNDNKMRHLDEELPGIREYFDVIVTSDMIKKSKPDPEGYLKGASLINMPIERCVVFEDSLQGVKSGKNAGAYVVGIIGTMPADTLAPYCDILVRDLASVDPEQLIRSIDAKQQYSFGRTIKADNS